MTLKKTNFNNEAKKFLWIIRPEIFVEKEPEHDVHWFGSGPLHDEHDEWQGEHVCDVSER